MAIIRNTFRHDRDVRMIRSLNYNKYFKESNENSRQYERVDKNVRREMKSIRKNIKEL